MPDRLRANEFAIGFADSPASRSLPSSPREILTNSDRCLAVHHAAGGPAEVWLVVPDDAGFYTYAAAYLWKLLIEAGKPSRTRGGHTDWTSHHLPRLATDTDYGRARFEYLLAAYAEAELGCRHIPCPPPLRLRGVFLAACRRRADFAGCAVWRLFDAARKAIEVALLNPFYDSLLEADTDSEWRPELRMLARDAAAYRRDVQRAKRLVIAFPRLDEAGAETHEYQVHEVAWLEDEPESLLFPDWVWRDRRHSAERKGFAVARYAAGDQPVFAIDPRITLEKTLDEKGNPRRADVSPLAQMLSECEAKKRGGLPWREAAGRLEDARSGWWSVRGPAGDRRRTSAEEEKAILERLAWKGIFAEDGFRIIAQFPSGAGCKHIAHTPYEGNALPLKDLETSPSAPRNEGGYLFASIRLRPELGTTIPEPAVRLIGETLWKAIRPNKHLPMPPDLKRHRQGDAGTITVWNRCGLAVAYEEGVSEARALHAALKEGLCSMARTDRDFKRYLEILRVKEEKKSHAPAAAKSPGASPAGASGGAGRASDGPAETAPGPREGNERDLRDRILRDYAGLRSEFSKPAGRLLRRLFEETEQADTHSAVAQQMMQGELNEITREQAKSEAALEWLEIFVVGFYLVEFSHYAADYIPAPDGLPFFLGAFVLAFLALFFLFWSHRHGRRKLRQEKSEAPGWKPSRLEVWAQGFLVFVVFLIALAPLSLRRQTGNSPAAEEEQTLAVLKDLEKSVGQLQGSVDHLAKAVAAGEVPRAARDHAPRPPRAREGSPPRRER